MEGDAKPWVVSAGDDGDDGGDDNYDNDDELWWRHYTVHSRTYIPPLYPAGQPSNP